VAAGIEKTASLPCTRPAQPEIGIRKQSADIGRPDDFEKLPAFAQRGKGTRRVASKPWNMHMSKSVKKRKGLSAKGRLTYTT